MSKVANINGIGVYSDKRVLLIVNTKVTFTDGSWCDVSTGEVSNQGDGYINIGSPNSGDNKRSKKKKVFSALPLEVKNVMVDLDIQINPNNQVEVIIEGPKAAINDIDISDIGGSRVLVTGKGEDDGNSISISSGFIRVSCEKNIQVSGNVSISGSSVNITSGSDNKCATKITVKVPRDTNINLSGISGYTKVGDINGQMIINASAGGDYKIGRVKNATLNVQGSGDIAITEVNGGLNINVMGSGDVKVTKGDVVLLNASVMGSGDVTFNGKAVNANLSIGGSGDIEVNYVKNKPITNVNGSGDIEVSNW